MLEYIHRDVEDTVFMEWYNHVMNTSSIKPALFVHGARQVGKTETVKYFSKEYFENVYYINFVCNIVAVNIIKDNIHNMNYNIPLNVMQNLFDDKFIDYKNSVIIFDEIQFYPEFYDILKYFVLYLKSQIILISSYSGIIKNSNYVFNVYMTGFTFKEFLRITGNIRMIDVINTNIKLVNPFPANIHKYLSELFCIYIKCGCYPVTLVPYVNNEDIEVYFYMLKDFINLYIKEFTVHIKNVNKRLYLDHEQYYMHNILYNLVYTTENNFRDFNLVYSPDIVYDKIGYSTVVAWLNGCNVTTQSYEYDILNDSIKSLYKCRTYLRDVTLANAVLENIDKATDIIVEGYVCSVLEDMKSKNVGSIPNSIGYIKTPSKKIIFIVNTIYGKTAVDINLNSDKEDIYLIDLLKNKKIDFIIRTGMSNLGREGNILTVPLYAFLFLDLRISDDVRLGFDKMDSDFMKEFKEKQKNNYHIKPMKFFE